MFILPSLKIQVYLREQGYSSGLFALPVSVKGLEIRNVGNLLKHIFPKFQAERSHPWGVNGCSKFAKNPKHFEFLVSKIKTSGII